LATETSLRIRHYIFYLKVTFGDICFTYSSNLIYKYIPGKCTNSHGYRDNEYSYKKPNGVFRIVIIGDSIAEGEYVQQHESFGKILEKKLNL
jgi:hypothetical protein